ncbi:MAG: HDIG domain-containing protein [Verrucomicrobiae bacterium]|nr:HDIG domain-containing protein [Verrucomicrobiae bacterium]
MKLPDKDEAKSLLHQYVQDEYQLYHAVMVSTAMEGYAEQLGEDTYLWWVTGYLHDIDFEKHPETHPGESLRWFADWEYPEDLIHAVEAHAYGYNGYSTLPQSKLAASLLACDEICGIFYAYQKMNPIPYGQMKAKSIRKKIKDKSFAAKVDRATIDLGCEKLGVPLNNHIENLIGFFQELG